MCCHGCVCGREGGGGLRIGPVAGVNIWLDEVVQSEGAMFSV